MKQLLIFLSHRGSLSNVNDDGNKTSKEVRSLSKRTTTLRVYRTFGYNSLSSLSFAQLRYLISVIPNSKFYRENVEVLRRISTSCIQTCLQLHQNSGLHSINWVSRNNRYDWLCNVEWDWKLRIKKGTVSSISGPVKSWK